MIELKKEQCYLDETVEVIYDHLKQENAFLTSFREDAQKHNKEMIEETSHDYSDINVRADLSQHLLSYQRNETKLKASTKKVEILNLMIKKPYFSRLDFTEDGYDTERLYIGICNLFDKDTLDIRVYDWRSPIAGLYYENKYGQLSYESPEGEVKGVVTLKRQFLFDQGRIESYHDLKDNAIDSQLLEVVSSTGSEKLHSVVETIQQKQNDIIRTDDIDLLFVKGVPGSGKSIIAMHRLAYLMYHGQKKYNAQNMLIISPNQFFKQYIDEVLPELGERSVSQKTYEDLLLETVGEGIETYASHMDRVMKKCISSFKNTKEYFDLLEKWFEYYLRNLHPYEDIYYNHNTLVKKDVIKNWFLRHKGKTPLSIGADKFRAIAHSEQDYLQYNVKEKLENITEQLGNHKLHATEAVEKKLKQYNKRLELQLNKSLKLSPNSVYLKMFENRELLRSLVEFDILDDFFTRSNHYEDFHGIFLYHSWINSIQAYKQYKYIVIDESQDYNYVQLYLMKKLFKSANFTILGDMNQTLHHTKLATYHHDLEGIFKPNQMKMIELETCYRSTSSITEFANQFINTEVRAFSRPGDVPKSIETTSSRLEHEVAAAIKELHDLESIAIIVHTSEEAEKLHKKLKQTFEISCMMGYSTKMNHNLVILPIYYAKGLEYDGVIYVSNRQKHHLYEQFAYTAATRAKHQLRFIEVT
ncbi:MAG: UvrD-helicase domain-containing protein [Clostridiales bacterium]|nr:UvrD-helicase domain-containing protein [Clostridiales bacterium]